jgi:hypothetical protein
MNAAFVMAGLVPAIHPLREELLRRNDGPPEIGFAKSLITHPATTTHQRLTPAVRAQSQERVRSKGAGKGEAVTKDDEDGF